MGIQGLLQVLKPIISDCNVELFKGKRVAVDGYCWLHRAVYGCCMELCKNEESDVWVRYFLALVELLLNAHIEVTLVFDGTNLPAKEHVEMSRSSTRQSNIQKARLYESSGDMKNARLYYSRATFATPRMAAILIRIMRQSHPNVKCIVAPYEADAQLSYLSINNLVDIVISEDSDNIPYGCKEILFKLDMNGNCQRLVLNDLYTKMVPGFDLRTFNQEMVVTMCIASGCDYLSSAKGVGLKTSYKIVQKQKTVAGVLRNMRLTGLIPLVPANSIAITTNDSSQEYDSNSSSGCEAVYVASQEQCVDDNDVTLSETSETVVVMVNNNSKNNSSGKASSRYAVRDGSQELMRTLPSSVLLYELEFYKALATFTHQTVFDPIQRKVVHRVPIIHTDLPQCLQILYPTTTPTSLHKDMQVVNMHFLGSVGIDDVIACGVADGLLDPTSKRPFNLPEYMERPTLSRSMSMGSNYSNSSSSYNSQSPNYRTNNITTNINSSMYKSNTITTAGIATSTQNSGGNSSNSTFKFKSTPSYTSHAQSLATTANSNNSGMKRKLPPSITSFFTPHSTSSTASTIKRSVSTACYTGSLFSDRTPDRTDRAEGANAGTGSLNSTEKQVISGVIKRDNFMLSGYNIHPITGTTSHTASTTQTTTTAVRTINNTTTTAEKKSQFWFENVSELSDNRQNAKISPDSITELYETDCTVVDVANKGSSGCTSLSDYNQFTPFATHTNNKNKTTTTTASVATTNTTLSKYDVYDLTGSNTNSPMLSSIHTVAKQTPSTVGSVIASKPLFVECQQTVNEVIGMYNTVDTDVICDVGGIVDGSNCDSMQQKYVTAMQNVDVEVGSATPQHMKLLQHQQHRPQLRRQYSLPTPNVSRSNTVESLKRLNSIRITQAQLALQKREKVDHVEHYFGISVKDHIHTVGESVEMDDKNILMNSNSNSNVMTNYELSLSPPVRMKYDHSTTNGDIRHTTGTDMKAYSNVTENDKENSNSEDSNPFAQFMCTSK